MKILDCTLRDGGYYNSWNFDQRLVESYLQGMVSAGVDVVEIGFRFAVVDPRYGAYATSGDHFLTLLDLPPQLEYAVMINATDFVSQGKLDRDLLEQIFPNSSDKSPVSIVRIAVDAKMALDVGELINAVNQKGFRVFLNCMQISEMTPAELTTLLRALEYDNLTAIYFADSLGKLNPTSTIELCSIFSDLSPIQFGIHAHNNKGLALENSLTALQYGATWVDSTMLGMGRGPGNTRTEELLLSTKPPIGDSLELNNLFTSLFEDFYPLQEEYRWGPNVFYFASALGGVHPTYIQRMLDDNNLSNMERLRAAFRLTEVSAQRFKSDRLDNVVSSLLVQQRWGDGGGLDDCVQPNVILLGKGESVLQNSTAIRAAARKLSATVVSVNQPISALADIVSLVCVSSMAKASHEMPSRMLGRYQVVAPVSRIAAERFLVDANVIDFGLAVEDQFSVEDDYCTTPDDLGLAYALGVVTRGGAKRVYLAGFDDSPDQDFLKDRLRNIVVKFEVDTGVTVISLVGRTSGVAHENIYDIIR